MEHALAEPLGRLAVNVRSSRADAVDPKSVIDPSADRSDAFVRVWVDVSASDHVTLYFVDAAWERILVRHVPTPNALDEVEREEIAQIVRSAVEALLGGAKLGITRDEARAELLPKPSHESPAPPPPAPKAPARKPARAGAAPPQPHSLGVDAGAFYEGARSTRLALARPGSHRRRGEEGRAGLGRPGHAAIPHAGHHRRRPPRGAAASVGDARPSRAASGRQAASGSRPQQVPGWI
ncbi:MAG: hypothetical protein U0263_40200 [Polyangiaceae bacterium]